MSEYWVSTKKKYCEICKIWFADNKVSVENHERGMGHKINVQKRLRDMGKEAKDREAQVN
jgi:WW domain-binding protein 4